MAACAFRAHLAEYGVIVPQGRHRVDALVAKLDEIREDLPEDACFALDALVGQLDALNQQIDGIDIRIAEIHKTNSICRLLATIPGIGPITATAFAATIPDPSPCSFKMPMIWSSVNLLRFISGPFGWARAYLKLD
jgi:transposase